jgi:serine protease Do
MRCVFPRAALCALCLCGPLVATARADHSFAEIARQVNPKVVKVFGAGGFRGITAYCTGALVSPDGFILTVYSPTLDSREIRVHLYDGTRHAAELVAAEPLMDVALLKIKDAEPFKAVPLPYFDLTKKPPEVKVGDWVLAFSNLFEIATRDEPVSVQRGVIAAIAPFAGRRGMTESNYKGTAYIVDAITNNPGAHGGVLTTRKGELVGLIGKELRNTLTETWVNYAMPVKDLTDFVAKGKRGEYKQIVRDDVKREDKGAYHGIVLVPDVLDRTPPYIEEVYPDSPAAKAGLKPDDIIVFLRYPSPEAGGELEERVVNDVKAFKSLMAPLEPGTTVKVVVRRGMQLLSLDLVLDPPRKKGVQ